jgi:prepilin-type N-terminal cleavage/methylation domain-containing protein
MKNPLHTIRRRGFTLLETVIAIGVLAVLLTGFMVVFAPAAAGIKRAINVQEADRLASTVEQELVTLRGSTQTTEFKTGFGKAFKLIEKSTASANDALLVYQYRGSMSSLRSDDTPAPVANVQGKLPGKDYKVQTMVRRKSDAEFANDLTAIEGGVYMVKCTQLIFSGGELKPGTPGKIADPKKADTPVTGPDDYPEAVIAFSADFHSVPTKAKGYFDGGKFSEFFTKAKNPVFTRNLAVRR